MRCVRGLGWVEMERCRPSVGPGEAEAMGFNYLLGTSHIDLDPDLEETCPFNFAILLEVSGTVKLKLKNGHTVHATCPGRPHFVGR